VTGALRDDAPATDDRAIALRSVRAIGTSATVAVTAPEHADRAMAMLASDLSDLDRTCSRFRPDSELRQLERASQGRPVRVSPLLFDLLEVACVVAAQTAGVVDPTVGAALVELGYDRDFDRLPPDAISSSGRPAPAPGWWRILLDPGATTVSVPACVHVDLGASAKAFAADGGARRIAASFGCGTLVNLGGDVAVAGPAPSGGWNVGIAPECQAPIDRVDQVVSLASGGLASSGTTSRAWVQDGRRVHHIVDPWTGDPAPAVWSLVSATASTCVEANAWTTAAVVWGEDAVGNLAALGVPARLVATDGSVVRTQGWPPAGDRAPTAAGEAAG
jgi:FAD:protein FMN transferase